MLTNTDWDEQAFNARRVEHLLRSTACEDGSIIIDDTGILKQGKGVVGVARQYFGTLGKVGNCQVVVSLQYYEGRLWYGLHRNLTLVMWAYSWLAAKRHTRIERITDTDLPANAPGVAGCFPLQTH